MSLSHELHIETDMYLHTPAYSEAIQIPKRNDLLLVHSSIIPLRHETVFLGEVKCFSTFCGNQGQYFSLLGDNGCPDSARSTSNAPKDEYP